MLLVEHEWRVHEGLVEPEPKVEPHPPGALREGEEMDVALDADRLEVVATGRPFDLASRGDPRTYAPR